MMIIPVLETGKIAFLIGRVVFSEDDGNEPEPYIVFLQCKEILSSYFKEILPEEVLGALRNILQAHLFPALLFLHRNGIIHGDIKAENIMKQDKHWKIIDFGCAGELDDLATGCTYIAPEINRLLHGKSSPNRKPKCTVQMDAFAFGIMLLEIIKLSPATKGTALGVPATTASLHVGYARDLNKETNTQVVCKNPISSEIVLI
jgi:serine/threonine protein kinase